MKSDSGVFSSPYVPLIHVDAFAMIHYDRVDKNDYEAITRFIAQFDTGIEFIENPTEEQIKLHEMLWVL